MVEIRNAQMNDALWIHRAEKEIFSDPWSCESIESHLASGFGSGLILTADGERVGYLLANEIAGEAELLRIGIREDLRKRGLGKALLTHWLETKKERGVYHFFLEVRKENESARALYEKSGFSVAGIRERYYKSPVSDAVLYQYHLKESKQ